MAKKKSAIVTVNAYIGTKKYAAEKRAYINDVEFSAAFDAAEAEDADQIDVNVNSAGGNILNGNSMINRMKKSPKKVVAHIDAIAASMGYFICLGASEIHAAKNSLIMPHSAQGSVTGTPEEMEAEAQVLKKFRASIAVSLAARMKKTVDEVTADFLGEDKWYTAEEALAAGLIDVIDDFDAVNPLPEAALTKVPYGEFVAQWNPAPSPAPAPAPVAALISSLNSDERWFYEDLIYGERNKINAANSVIKYSSNSAVLDFAKKILGDCGAEIIRLTTLLYGEGVDATAELEEIMTTRNAKLEETFTAKATIDFAAKIKLKDTAIAKLTTERDAAVKSLDEKTAVVNDLEAQLLNRETETEEKKDKGDAGASAAKYSYTKNRFGNK